MPRFRCLDPGNLLGHGTDSIVPLRLSRALTLLAIASAPNPGSRYQPGSNWGVAKYATAVDPRSSSGGGQRAIANIGIRDLDPHQKTTLADDFGVAISLALIDAACGIDGLADCYALWLEEVLSLRTGGRHRRMPDFLLLLRKPLSGSTLVLLECKGSTQSVMAGRQLGSACAQLDNVIEVAGVPCAHGMVPKIAMASTIHPGEPVEIRVDDPPEPLNIPPEVEMKLRANFVALELAAFGDLAAAEAIRFRYSLPSWARFGIPDGLLQGSKDLRLEQTMLITLPAFKRLPLLARDELDLEIVQRLCLARVRYVAEGSPRAVALRESPSNDQMLGDNSHTERSEYGVDSSHIHRDDDGRLRCEESDRTSGGTQSRLSVEVWPATT